MLNVPLSTLICSIFALSNSITKYASVFVSQYSTALGRYPVLSISFITSYSFFTRTSVPFLISILQASRSWELVCLSLRIVPKFPLPIISTTSQSLDYIYFISVSNNNLQPYRVYSTMYHIMEQNQTEEYLNQPQGESESRLTDSEQEREFQRIKSSRRELNLKPEWLTSTTTAINKITTQLSNIKVGQSHLQTLLKDLDIKKKNFDLLSQSKQQIMQYSETNRKNKRSIIESMHPMVMVEVYSFLSPQPYLLILKHTKISKYFYYLSQDDYVVNYFGYKLLGFRISQLFNEKGTQALQKELHSYMKQYLFMIHCLRYYKQLQYQKNLPKNSFLNDLVQSLEFINKVFELSLYDSLELQDKINGYLLANRGVMALENLGSMNVPVLQMNALQALINHIAVNESLKMTQPIQSKSLKVLLRNQEMRVHMLFNAKISPLLYQSGYQYSLLKTNKKHTMEISESVRVIVITMLGQKVAQFIGEVHEIQGKWVIIGCDCEIEIQDMQNKRSKAHFKKQQLQGISTLALVNNTQKVLHVYLNQDTCLIIDPL